MSSYPTPADRSYNPAGLARRSVDLVRSIAKVAGEGAHHLFVALVNLDGVREAECTITGPVLDDQTPDDAVAKAAFLLAGTVCCGTAMVILRTVGPDGQATVMSWAVNDLTARPGTAEQSRMAHCISEDRDDMAPTPGFRFVDAPALA
ncbi:hypothetical protein [Streptomyces sp. A1136]|uniref:hypothetical protein n=1 Tax=Streptomyces sp. A1136 TaxID=2563102 RepID=UPI00109ECC7D|nr:hypothetical protein [Streptomyces sp. A1136]THA44654.1 hypothetical protein E6R62_36625 [Streptomyces sp. A1136]